MYQYNVKKKKTPSVKQNINKKKKKCQIKCQIKI